MRRTDCSVFDSLRLNRGGLVKLNQSGMSLLELLISLSLGLLLLTGIGTIYVGSNQTYRVQEQNARIQESGRYALDVIGRSLRQAGYRNISLVPDAFLTDFAGVPITGTATTVTVQYDGTGGPNCIGTGVAVGTIVNDAFDLNGTDLRCNNQPLVSNVEDLQFLYGIDNDVPSDNSADQYIAAPTAAQLGQIVSVRACVLIRSEDTGIASTNQRYLNCAGALGTAATAAAEYTTAPASDNRRLHRAFVATFNLRNRVP
jgi:type IV pilus assembly protein PilW